MPCLKIITNISKSNIPKDFMSKITNVLGEAVNKDPKIFMCTLEGDSQIYIEGNSTLPGVIASLEAVGILGPNVNKQIVKLLTTFIEKELGVPPNRFFLTFYDLKPCNVGLWGITIDTLNQ